MEHFPQAGDADYDVAIAAGRSDAVRWSAIKSSSDLGGAHSGVESLIFL